MLALICCYIFEDPSIVVIGMCVCGWLVGWLDDDRIFLCFATDFGRT